MKAIIQRLKSNRFFTSTLSIGSGNFFAQVVTIVTIPLLARIYSTEAYGEFGIITSTAAIITSIASLGLLSAIMAPEGDKESSSVFMAVFYTQLFISTLFALVAICISDIYKFYAVSGSYILSVLVMWLYIVLTDIKFSLQVFVNRKGLNKVLFANPIIGACCNLLIALPLGLIKFGYLGFFTATIISEIIMILQMTMKSKPFDFSFRLRDYKQTLKKYKDYVLFQFPSNAVGTTAQQYPAQFFSRVFDNVILGSYSMSLKLLEYPTRLIARPISTVYFRTASEYKREGKNLAGFTYRLITRIMLIAIIPVIVVQLFGEQLVVFVLGSDWAEAGQMVSVLILQYVLAFCAQCTSYCRVSLGRQRLDLVYTVIRFLVVIFSCSLGYFIYGDLVGTIQFFSIGQILLYIFDMSLNFYCMKKYTFKYLLFSLVYVTIVFGSFLMKSFYLS